MAKRKVKKTTRKAKTPLRTKGGSTMEPDAEKMILTGSALKEAEKAHDAAQAKFLAPDRPLTNVVGMGLGVKWTDGRPTGEPAVLVLVSQKVEADQLSDSDRVDLIKLPGMQTDVLAVGHLFAGTDAPEEAGIQKLTQRVRPAEGGYSVGHYKITAGTIATCVYDVLPGGAFRKPEHGIGKPPRYYILSNNHVLANCNNASPGDPILQPGPADGGTDPADRIARLSRWIDIDFGPFLHLHNNLVDAAVAAGEFHDLDREIYWIGYVRGWRPKVKVTVGTVVQKTGRTTNFTTGRITAVKAIVNVGYGGGRVARFKDQIVTTDMSAGGDSGSLITTLDNVAVGLLFAGSSTATIANQIENVRSLLRVEVAEQIL